LASAWSSTVEFNVLLLIYTLNMTLDHRKKLLSIRHW
jgi:hypothetical protein